MACAVSICLDIVTRPPLAVDDPLPCTVRVFIFRMCRHEHLGLRPQRWDALGCVVEIDRETVGLVVVLHPAEDIVVYVAEEMYLWLDAPIVANFFEGWVFVEHAAVPSAHLMVGYERTVLNALFLQNLGGLIEEVAVDPVGDCPVFFRDEFYGIIVSNH